MESSALLVHAPIPNSYGSAGLPHPRNTSTNNRRIVSLLAGLMLAAVVGLVVVAATMNNNSEIISLRSMLGAFVTTKAAVVAPSPTTAPDLKGPDRFEFVHSFGGYGQGGRDRVLQVAPPRVLLGADGTPIDAVASPPAPAPAAAAPAAATTTTTTNSGSAVAPPSAPAAPSAPGSVASPTPSAPAPPPGIPGNAGAPVPPGAAGAAANAASAAAAATLPPSLTTYLAAFGVQCTGACSTPRAVLLLAALTEIGLNVQTGAGVSGPPPHPPPPSPILGVGGASLSDLLSFFVVDATMVGDVRIVERKGGKLASVVVSSSVFEGGDTQQATLDGVKGVLFSLRLRAVIIALSTDFGSRASTCDDLCNRLFSCHFADAIHPNYTALTAPTTAEGPGRFANFLPREKFEILQWWYHMPNVLHKLPGLAWVVRRQYALEHPYYTYVPAVSWPDNQDQSYMEFLDITFSRDCDTMRHLFLHEKTHFYYSRVMTQAQKDNWDNLGGWTKDWNGNWGALGTTTEFVSGYAASVDPNEDIAETVAEYILHPALVRTRSIAKYNFLRDNVMNGYEYLPEFWPRASFSVVNTVANEDIYPNPVTHIQIIVTGSEFEDKNVTVILHLKENHGWGSPLTATLDIGPPSGFSDAGVTLSFVQTGNVLKAETLIHKTEEYGFWRSDQLHIHDALGITRWIHLDESNFRLYINNKYSADDPLVYQPQSLTVRVDTATSEDTPYPNPSKLGDKGVVPRVVVGFSYSGYHRPYYRWPAAVRLVRQDATQSYYVEGWGHCNHWDHGAGIAQCEITVLLCTHVKGAWYVAQVFMQESTGRSYREFFSPYTWDEPATIFQVPGLGTDDTPPEINTLSFDVKASPVNAAAPDGETVIEFSFEARDEESGLKKWTYRLLDPSGVSHLQTITIAENTDSDADDIKWKKLKGLITMPKGSPPGIWGVEEVEVWDRAGNRADLRMVDTRVFVPTASLPNGGVGALNIGLIMNSGDADGGGDGAQQQ